MNGYQFVSYVWFLLNIGTYLWVIYLESFKDKAWWVHAYKAVCLIVFMVLALLVLVFGVRATISDPTDRNAMDE